MWLHLTQVVEGKDDAEHKEAAVEQGCGAAVEHGSKQSGSGRSNGIRRCGASNAHDH